MEDFFLVGYAKGFSPGGVGHLGRARDGNPKESWVRRRTVCLLLLYRHLPRRIDYKQTFMKTLPEARGHCQRLFNKFELSLQLKRMPLALVPNSANLMWFHLYY